MYSTILFASFIHTPQNLCAETRRRREVQHYLFSTEIFDDHYDIIV